MVVKYFLGLGQGKRAVQWLRKQLPSVEFYEAPNYLKQQTNTAMTNVGVEAVQKGVGAAGEYVICAESQAVPAVIESLYRRGVPQPTRLVLIQPLGLNYDALGTTSTTRRRELFRRSRRFWQHSNQSLSVKGNLWTACHILINSTRYAHRLTRAYSFGANQDYCHQLRQVAKDIPIDIYACDDDSLFPYHEIAQSLEGTDIIIHKLPGTHLNRATPAGLAQLQTILPNVLASR